MVLDAAQAKTAEELRDILARSLAASERGEEVTMVADADGVGVVGSASLHRLRPAYCRHVAVLALGVHPAHQRRGIGRSLLEALLAWARAHGLVRIELYVRADNHRARALYRDLGFVQEGVRARFVRLPDGTYVDDLIMARFLDRAAPPRSPRPPSP